MPAAWAGPRLASCGRWPDTRGIGPCPAVRPGPTLAVMITSNGPASADRRPRTHLVVMVLYDGVQALDVTGPMDVLAAANDHGGRYRVVALSPSGKEVRTTSGLRLASDGVLEEWSGRIGTLMVPGSPNWHVSVEDHGLIEELTRLARSARRCAPLCAGAFPLAAAGLLDGVVWATHWRQADQLAARFPSVHVDRDALFIRDGRIIILGGRDSRHRPDAVAGGGGGPGAEAARAAAKDLVVFMARPGGRSSSVSGCAHGTAAARRSVRCWTPWRPLPTWITGWARWRQGRA